MSIEIKPLRPSAELVAKMSTREGATTYVAEIIRRIETDLERLRQAVEVIQASR